MMQIQNSHTSPAPAMNGTAPGSYASPETNWEVRPMPAGTGWTAPPSASGTAWETRSVQPDWSREVRSMPAQTEAAAPAYPAPPPPMDLRHGLPADVINSPLTLQEAQLGSLKAMLSKYVGSYIVATYLVGTQNMVSWEGILYEVGNDYLTIYQESRDRYIVTDYYSLKFVEFYDTRRREYCRSVMEAAENAGSAMG